MPFIDPSDGYAEISSRRAHERDALLWIVIILLALNLGVTMASCSASARPRPWQPFKRPGGTGNAKHGTSTEPEARILLATDVEELLSEQLGLLGGTSYPQRLEIEAELSEIRRELAGLRSRAF